MHPEILQDRPGACPICGMDLELKTLSAEEEDNPELLNMTRRFWVSLALTLPVLALAMGHMIPGIPWERLGSPRALTWVELLFATPVVLWCGWPFFTRGWASVVSRNLNMFTLIALGTGVAYIYSLIAAIYPDLFPPSFRDRNGIVSVYFEAAAVIVTLVLLGQVLELKARSRTGAAIRSLLGLAPKTARRLGENGEDEDIPLDQVQPGDRLRVRPGEKIPVDGVVVEGARARFARAGLGARCTIHPGSFRDDPLPRGADAISLIRVLYDHDDSTVAALLRAVHAALPSGGCLIVSEPMSGGAQPDPVTDVYFAFYTLAMQTGRTRSAAEIAALLAAEGFQNINVHKGFRPYVTSVITATRDGG
jgi:hypothetical protein